MPNYRARDRQETSRDGSGAIGNLLLDALALERYLARRYCRQPEDELLESWRLCRRTVNHLVKDYTDAVARYRRVVRGRFADRAGTR